MEKYIESLEGIVARRLQFYDRDSEELNLIANFIGKVSVVTGATPAAASEIWEMVRTNGDITNLLLDILAEFRFRNGLDKRSWEDFCGTLAECLTFLGQDVVKELVAKIGVGKISGYEVTDKVLLDRLYGSDRVKVLLQINPWYVIVILLTFCDIKVISPIAKRVK